MPPCPSNLRECCLTRIAFRVLRDTLPRIPVLLRQAHRSTPVESTTTRSTQPRYGPEK